MKDSKTWIESGIGCHFFGQVADHQLASCQGSWGVGYSLQEGQRNIYQFRFGFPPIFQANFFFESLFTCAPRKLKNTLMVKIKPKRCFLTIFNYFFWSRWFLTSIQTIDLLFFLIRFFRKYQDLYLLFLCSLIMTGCLELENSSFLYTCSCQIISILFFQ